MARFRLMALIGALCLATGSAAHDGASKTQLLSVQRWLLLLNNELSPSIVRRIADSSYDMAVVDDVATLSWNPHYDIAGTVHTLQVRPGGGHRLVLSYLNIGRAEDYRSYFRTAWKAKPPSWTLGGKPAGAGGDYPVAYWRPEWKDILVGNDGLVPKIARAGFDGAYLDWIAGYWDSAVIARAHADGVDPRAEMLLLLRQVATAARAINPQFLLVVQNAPELADSSDVVELTDAFAQESMWFAGAEGDSPSGDCPMSRTNKELGSPTYLARLSGPCKRARDEGRAEVLNYAQQAEVVPLLSRARSRGLAVFTVDYALRAENIAEASRQSRALGFRPFVGAHGLKKFVNPQF